MQLREKEDISKIFIFRLGELHTVFAALKVLGKYMAGSGLDRLLTESEFMTKSHLVKVWKENI